MRIGAAIAAFLLITPAQAQFNGVTFAAGAANIPNPDFSQCDFNTPTTFTHIWYVDPSAGQTQSAMGTAGISLDPTITPHQGDSTHPWNSLQAVFSTITGYPRPLLTTAQGGSGTLSPIAPGDEILLNTGSATAYGAINASAGFTVLINNPTYLTIAAAPGQTPIFSSLNISNATRLHFLNITVMPTTTPSSNLVVVSGNPASASSKNIVLDNISISATDYATASTWTTQAQYAAGLGTSPLTSGFYAGANESCTALINSHIFLTYNGLGMLWPNRLLIQNTEIDHFGYDAIDYAGQFVVINVNFLDDPFNLGDSTLHMDFMQGQSGTSPANHDFWINGNTEIFQTDPALPFNTGGAWDGGIVQTNDQWSNLFITNNLVSIGPFPHGIGVGGCNDCVVANNTVTGRLEVNVANIGAGGRYASSNITVTNNIMGSSSCTDPTVTMTNNVVMHGTANTFCYGGATSGSVSASGPYGTNIIDVGGLNTELTDIDTVGLVYNFHLLSGAPARGFGRSALPRPLVDQLGRPLNSPVDAGALAYP